MTLLFLILACAPDPVADDTTLDANVAALGLGGSPASPAPVFEPYAFFLSGWTGLDQGEVVDPGPDATITLTFWTEEGFRNGDAAESCAWTGHVDVIAPAQIVDAPDVWTAAQVELDLIATDCLAFDGDIWGENTPTSALTGARVALGHGPMSPSMHALMTRHHDRHSLAWGRVADAAFSTWFAIDSGAGFEGIEAGGALAYDPDSDGPLVPLDWDETLPDGVVYTQTVTPLGPAWIE